MRLGAPPILVFSGDWDVHWEYGILTHSQIDSCAPSLLRMPFFSGAFSGVRRDISSGLKVARPPFAKDLK